MKDKMTLATELQDIGSLLEVLSIYFQGIIASPPAIDVIDDEGAAGAIRAVSAYVNRISDDMSDGGRERI